MDDGSDNSAMIKMAVASTVVVGGVLVTNYLTPAPVKILKLPPTAGEDGNNWSPYIAGQSGGAIDIDTVGEIRYAKEGFASKEKCPASTVTEQLRKAAKKSGSKVAMRQEVGLPAWKKGDKIPPSKPITEWKAWTYQQYLDECELVAKAFMALGMKRFDAVNIFGFNSPEWFIAELATIAGGGIAAGIYPTDTPDQVAFKAKHSGASIAAVDNLKKAGMFTDRAKDLPKMKAIVVWGDEKFEQYVENGIKVLPWSALADLGKQTDDSELEKRIADQKPGHCCCLIYTSGTTGDPKAVMISHDNILFESLNVLDTGSKFLGQEGDEERILSYLPLSHVAGMMVDIVTPIVLTASKNASSVVHFARVYDLKAGSFGDRLRAVRPTMFLGVPRVWEKIAEKMKAMVAKNPLTGVKLKVARWAKTKGLAHQNNCQLGGSGAKGFLYGFAQKKVLDMVRLKLGLDACKFAFTGAAPITTDTLEYYGALGIQINEVYGMSECTGATTFSLDEAHVWGSCGWAMQGMEVKILDLNGKECPRASSLVKPEEQSQGEICYRGRHIMLGYMANPSLGDDHVKKIRGKTDDAITEDGWLKSGDKGCMDTRGMVKITGRYKELIIGAGGENIAPVPLEDNVKKLHTGISNIMMVGDKRKFNVALITLKAKGATGVTPGGDDLDVGALEIVPGVNKISQAVKDEKWIKSVLDVIVATNNDGSVCPSNAAKIGKFTILPADFSVETEEFTPTYKLKRSVVEKKHKDLIDRFFLPENIKKAYIPFSN